MKYIVVRDMDRFGSHFGDEFGIVFPDVLVHREVARIHRLDQRVLVSAGFCCYRDGVWSVWGESESCRVGSRSVDADVLSRSFGGFGV